MDKFEKITFFYPTLLRAGMPVNTAYYPDVVIHKSPDNNTYPLALTAGMVFNKNEVYISEIDVFFEGETVTLESSTSGKSHVIMHDLINDNQSVYISSMYMQVILQKAGIYTAIIKLFKTNNGEKFGDPIDEKSCDFIVPSFRDGK